MPRLDPSIDEFTLLCERCGYVLEGLDTSGSCPECGMLISKSLPARRIGTLWQRMPAGTTPYRTAWRVLVAPWRTLGEMRIDPQSSMRFRDACVWRAAGVLSISTAVSISLQTVFDVVAHSVIDVGAVLNQLILWMTGSFMVLMLIAMATLAMCSMLAFGFITLTLIEQRGLRFIGARRGLRVTQAVAASVCGHGCAGWLIGALGASACMLGATAVSISLKRYPLDPQDFESSAPATIQATFALAIGVIVLPLLGFLFFETFAWLGLKRCKYANRERSTEHGATEHKPLETHRECSPGSSESGLSESGLSESGLSESGLSEFGQSESVAAESVPAQPIQAE